MPYLLLALPLAILLLAVAQTVSSKGGRRSLLRARGVTVREELGQFDTPEFIGFSQTIRVLECEQNGEAFLLLECTRTHRLKLAKYVSWLRLDRSNAEGLAALLAQGLPLALPAHDQTRPG